MDFPEKLAPIFKQLNKEEVITKEIIHDLSEFFPLEKVLKAIEYVSMGRIHDYIFKPSNRRCWFVTGREHSYYLIPHRFCSCKDYFLKGIIRNKFYLCKHLLGQVIYENLNKDKNTQSEGQSFNDEEFWEVFRDCI